MKIQSTRPLLGEYFRLHAKWRGAKPALVAEGETLTWRQFNGRLNRVANMVHAAGLSRGDRAIVFMDNGADMAVVLFGLVKAGVASAPLNLSVSDAAITVMIQDSGARAVFASRTHIARLGKIIASMGDDAPDVLIASGPDEGTAPKSLLWSDFTALRDAQSDCEPAALVEPDDILNIIYSSGTTGQPKGIIHTQQSRLDWAYDLAAALRYDGQSRMLATIGLYSNITWVGMLSVLLRGGCLVIAPRFDATACWQAIEAHRITHIAMVPILYQRLADHAAAQEVDTSHVRNLVSAGSPLRPELREALFGIFPCGITELYGLTEGVITTLDPEDAQGRMASAGLPLPGSDLMILDDQDQPCEPGHSGEIVMASRFVMPGYLNRPDETQAARYIDESGQHWLRTGDIGQLDADGYLYVVDRKKDMILSGGQNIYPQDIEAVLAGHADVADVAVIGVPSRKWGETPLALVAARNGGLDANALKDWTNAQLGRQQRIADIKVVAEIPRNPNGKVLKRQLREDFKGLNYD
jgi:acyl-CoA synthetase (AMP-forming)/AMP-acid ligase II